jgi:hypothetical protein
MKMKQVAVAGLIAIAAVGAQAAAITTTVGSQSATEFLLSDSNVSGGKLLQSGIDNVAAVPDGTTAGSWYLAGEDSGNGGAATVSFQTGTQSVSFDWGSPDSWNSLLVTLSNGTSQSFSASTLGLGSSYSYVDFSVSGGVWIQSMTFSASQPAFEASNFKVSVVPEPANVALLLAGLGMVGMMARRRRA